MTRTTAQTHFPADPHGRGPFTDGFRSFAQRLIDHFHVPSMAVGVIDGDKTFIETFGHSNIDNGGVRTTEDTLYYIASVTKSFTATTLLSVLDDLFDQAVTLESRISSIIPADFALKDDYATHHATLNDALGHLLGVGPHNLSYGGVYYTLRDAVQSLRHLSTTAEFREKHQYLNIGYMVIQHVIETLTRKSIGEMHHKHIWDPLGMTSTFIRLSDAQKADNVLATGYTWDELNQKLLQTPYTDDYPLVGGGGIITSIKDFTKYLSAVIHGKLPLKESSQKELFRPRSITGDPTYEHESPALYAAGWMVFNYRSHRVVSHSGGITGFSSKLVFLPDRKWGIAILTNADVNGRFAVETTMMRALDDYLGIPLVCRQNIALKYNDEMKNKAKSYLNSRQRLYPSIPDPPLPSTLPLAAYAGSYHNPGYRTLTLTVAKPPKGVPIAKHTTEVLHTGARRLVDFTLDLEHVSGDYFIGWGDSEVPNFTVKCGLRSRFVVGGDGKVESWGINMDPVSKADDDGMMVWFKRESSVADLMYTF